MPETTLYDFGPTLRLMLTGLCLALGPLGRLELRPGLGQLPLQAAEGPRACRQQKGLGLPGRQVSSRPGKVALAKDAHQDGMIGADAELAIKANPRQGGRCD
jgi:hypothetical protein